MLPGQHQVTPYPAIRDPDVMPLHPISTSQEYKALTAMQAGDSTRHAKWEDSDRYGTESEKRLMNAASRFHPSHNVAPMQTTAVPPREKVTTAAMCFETNIPRNSSSIFSRTPGIFLAPSTKKNDKRSRRHGSEEVDMPPRYQH